MQPNLQLFFNLPGYIFATKPWLFTLHYNISSSEENVKELIYEEFKNFKSVAFNSRMYVQAATIDRLFLFEFYKVTPNSRLTISQLYRIHLDTLKIEFVEKKNIWQRRKNLSEANFKIGLMLEHTSITNEQKQVTFISQKHGTFI